MGAYLGVKFEVSSIVLTDFRQEGVVFLPCQCSPPTSKQAPKNSIHIRVTVKNRLLELEKDFTELNYVEIK